LSRYSGFHLHFVLVKALNVGLAARCFAPPGLLVYVAVEGPREFEPSRMLVKME
jgi:hypothetical protein